MRRSPEQEKLYNEWAKNRVFNPVVPSFEERHKVGGQDFYIYGKAVEDCGRKRENS